MQSRISTHYSTKHKSRKVSFHSVRFTPSVLCFNASLSFMFAVRRDRPSHLLYCLCEFAVCCWASGNSQTINAPWSCSEVIDAAPVKAGTRGERLWNEERWHSSSFYAALYGAKTKNTLSPQAIFCLKAICSVHPGLGCCKKLQSPAPPVSPVPVKPIHVHIFETRHMWMSGNN